MFVFQRQKISPQMAQKILLKFDKTAPASLSSRLNNQVRFKVSVCVCVRTFNV